MLLSQLIVEDQNYDLTQFQHVQQPTSPKDIGPVVTFAEFQSASDFASLYWPIQFVSPQLDFETTRQKNLSTYIRMHQIIYIHWQNQRIAYFLSHQQLNFSKYLQSHYRERLTQFWIYQPFSLTLVHQHRPSDSSQNSQPQQFKFYYFLRSEWRAVKLFYIGKIYFFICKIYFYICKNTFTYVKTTHKWCKTTTKKCLQQLVPR